MVYKAEDTMLGRLVAIKRLLNKDSKILIQRFLAEAKSIAALNHPNIIQIYDIAEDSEGLMITTEFVDGSDLDVLIRAGKILKPKIAVKLIIPVCKALYYAHNKGVIHRDIKPANILVSNEGVPKIGDFGLARTQALKDIEVTGMVMGTKSYASPEQFKDSKHLDHRTDIYSLGAMFYEMLTGTSPQYYRDDDVPRPFLPIIKKAMATDPGNRYFQLKEMVEDITSVPSKRIVPKYDQTTVPAKPEPAPSIVAADDSEMMLISAGPFRFGPKRTIETLPAFYIDTYPVTNRQFERLKPSHQYPHGHENHPVVNISWIEANAYARKMGKRLPTEKEWEKAARGPKGLLFPWGNEHNPELCNTFESMLNTTTPVDAYPEGQSRYGVFDMSGNVWEWTSTWLEVKKSARILKGGAYNGEAKFAVCHARFAYPPQGTLPVAGFRCVKKA